MKQMKGWWTVDLSPRIIVLVPGSELLDVIVDSGFGG